MSDTDHKALYQRLAKAKDEIEAVMEALDYKPPLDDPSQEYWVSSIMDDKIWEESTAFVDAGTLTYHRHDCRYVAATHFIPLSSALCKDGAEPCKVCKPS